MFTVPKNSKRCGTCQYWMGNREVKGNYVYHDKVGICTAVRASKKGKEVSGSHYCSYWSKWVAI